MDSSRRDFFRLGGGNLLRKLADLAQGGLDRLSDCPQSPATPDEAGRALKSMQLKRRCPGSASRLPAAHHTVHPLPQSGPPELLHGRLQQPEVKTGASHRTGSQLSARSSTGKDDASCLPEGGVGVPMTMRPTLILGIGNILLRDEGIGVRVIEAMRDLTLPEGVEILDGGTSGADLIDEVADRPRLIVVDAIKAAVEPAAILRFSDKDLLERAEGPISLHEFGLVETLLAAKHLGCAPREVIIFGIQPNDISSGLELSSEVAAIVPKIAELVLKEACR